MTQSQRRRRFLGAVLAAFIVGVALESIVMDCDTLPWWSIDYWLYCKPGGSSGGGGGGGWGDGK